MANEHVLHIQTSIPLGYTVADGTGIEKGTLLKMADPMTVSAITASAGVVGGVAAREKIASNGMTQLAVWRAGVFKGVASGTITIGDPLISDSTGNKLVSGRATGNVSGTIIFGEALETASDTETFLWELRPTTTAQTGGS